MAVLVYEGSSLLATATFQDDDGNLANPPFVIFSTRAPNGTVTNYAYGTDADVLNASLGVFTLRFTATMNGRWLVLARGILSDNTPVSMMQTFDIEDTGF